VSETYGFLEGDMHVDSPAEVAQAVETVRRVCGAYVLAALSTPEVVQALAIIRAADRTTLKAVA
jgi:hypothetical protein